MTRSRRRLVRGLGLLLFVLLTPDGLGASFCDTLRTARLRNDRTNLWAEASCVPTYSGAGQWSLSVDLVDAGPGRFRVDAAPDRACRCGCDQVRVWVDGRGPYRHGETISLEPGWHRLYAEGSTAGRVRVVREETLFLCSPEPDQECHIRDFRLQGEEVNALIRERPTFTWTSAANTAECRPEGCVRSCEGPPASKPWYRVHLDGGREGSWTVPDDGCRVSWQMPPDAWDRLRPGFHTLTLQPMVARAGETSARAVKSLRYGFHKSAPLPTGPERAWPGEAPEPYRLESEVVCRSGCGPGASALLVEPAPGGAPHAPNRLEQALAGLTGNFAVDHRSQDMLLADLSRFRGVLEAAGGSVDLLPRWLPVETVRQGGRVGYRDLLADQRGRTTLGTCGEGGSPDQRAGVTPCPPEGATTPRRARIWWRQVPSHGRSAAWVQAVLTDLPFTAEPRTFLARVRVREAEGGVARLRIGWDSRAPRIEDWSTLPSHRTLGIRLRPGESREVLVRMPLAPPPPRPDGTSSPLLGRRHSLWIIAAADYGGVVVEDVQVHQVQEGFYAEVSSVPQRAQLDLYFGDADPVPSPVRTRTRLLDERELRNLDRSAARAVLHPQTFRRRGPGTEDRALVFAKQGPFTPVGPHAGPAADEVLARVGPEESTVLRRRTVHLTRRHDATETVAFGLLPGAGGLKLRVPGRGELRACGNILDYEVWTSLPALAQGTGWVWKDANQTPLVTNLYLTKGGRPWFDGRRSRFRADEAMPLDLDLDPGEARKILLNLRPRGPLRPGRCDAEVALGPIPLPLRIEVLDLDLAPERNQWVQLLTTRRWDDDRDPANGCTFDTTRWAAAQAGAPSCREDRLTGRLGEDPYWICDGDFDLLARRIREHGHVGLSTREACQILEPCNSARCLKEDPLGFHVARCLGAEGSPSARRKDSFTDLVERVARAWDRVSPLPREPGYDRAALRVGDRWRPWLSTSTWPGHSAWPACWAASPTPGCPEGASGNAALRAAPSARLMGSLRTIQDHRLGAWSFFSHMDNVGGGGVDRAVAFSVLLDSYHEAGVGGIVTSFRVEGDRPFSAAIETVRPATDPPRECFQTCEVDGEADLADLERQLRWGQLHGSTNPWCPDRYPRSGAGHWWNWTHFLAELERQRQISDAALGCSSSRCPAGCYCCADRTKGEDLCRSAAGAGSYAPWGSCPEDKRRPCRPGPGETRPWCPRFSAEPDAGGGGNPLDMASYVVGLDWFLRIQEECTPGRPCRWLRENQQEQAMFEENIWKWPFTSRFSSGFWAAASNVDAFHPYYLYGVPVEGHSMDLLNNFDAWGYQPLGFLHKVDARPDEGNECAGSCTGLIQLESWEALAAGHVDIRWWDTLLAADLPQACEEGRGRVVEMARALAFPYGVGRSHGPGMDRSPLHFPYPPNFWLHPGHPAEALGDADLEQVKERLLEVLRCYEEERPSS